MASKTLTQAELEAYPTEQLAPGDPFRYQAHGQWLVFDGREAFDVHVLSTIAPQRADLMVGLSVPAMVAMKAAVAELQAMIADHEDRLAVAEEMIVAAMNRKRPGPKPKLVDETSTEPEATEHAA